MSTVITPASMINKGKTEQERKFQPNNKIGIILSFICLFLLGILPIISNSRPSNLTALDYTLFLSIWQFIFSIPLFFKDLLGSDKGIFTKNVPRNIKQKTMIVIIITGLIFLISTFLYVFSFEKAGTINASIAMEAFPVFSIFLETFFLSKKKNKMELVFTAILIITLTYLATNGTFLPDKLSLWFILALTVPLLWSIAHITLKIFLDNSVITPAQIIFFRVGISSSVLFLSLLLLEGPSVIFTKLFNPVFQLYALAMGLVYYLELINWFFALKNIDVSLAGSITTPTPVITMFLAILFLKEVLFSYQLIALIIVCTSLYGLLYFGNQKSKNSKILKQLSTF
jgi:drug/metabolite transporter (DMT)-like permease